MFLSHLDYDKNYLKALLYIDIKLLQKPKPVLLLLFRIDYLEPANIRKMIPAVTYVTKNYVQLVL